MSGTGRLPFLATSADKRGLGTARSAKGSFQGSPERALTAVFLAMLCLELFATLWAVWDARRVTIREYHDRQTRLGLVLAEQTGRALQAVDLVVQATVEQIGASGLVTRTAFEQAMVTEAENGELRQKLANLPQLEALTLIDVNGKVLNTTRFWPPHDVDLSSGDLFQHYRQQDATETGFKRTADAGAYVSRPTKSLMAGNWTMFLSRPVVGSDGHLIGMVSGAISLKYFTDFFQAIDPDESGVITLLRRDGTVLVLHPLIENFIGKRLPGSLPWYGVVAAGGGLYESTAQVSGAARSTAVQPLRDYPLVIDVGVFEDVAMAAWRRQAVCIGLASAIVIGILLGLFLLLRKQFGRLANNARELRGAADALRRSQAELADKSAVLETTLRYMDQGIIMVTADLRVAVWNPRAAALLDLPEALLARRPHADELSAYQFASDEFMTAPETFRRMMRDNEALRTPHRYERRRPNGQVLEIKSTPMPNGGIIRTYSDVTDQRLAAERIATARDQAEAAREAAERANHAKTEFLANMSHEIRTPMNGIIGMNQLLLRSGLTAEQQEWAVGVRESAESLLSVIDDILDFAKLEAGKVELELSDFQLGDTVRAAVRLLDTRASEKRLTLVTTVDPASDRWVRGDPVRLRQVLINLVGNAVKFTERGAVQVRVAPDPDDPDQTRLEVEDTGIGMSAATLGRLFQKFSQADSSISRRFGGSGLGLAISRELTGLMGGAIVVDSTEGKGSLFRVVLPLPEAVDPGTAPPVAAVPEAPQRPLRLLVTDDNPINQRLLYALLRGAGHSVTAAVNGREAVQAVLQEDFDAILMDVQMPVMDGIQATRRIRAMPSPKRDVPIIALTADALRGAADRYRELGMDGYLSKPLSAGALFQTLNELTRPEWIRPSAALSMPDLDDGTISQLREFLTPDQLEAMLTETLTDIDARFLRLSASLGAADAMSAAREAHDLVSVAGNCGARALSELARDIERACRRGALDVAIRDFGNLRTVADNAIGALGGLRDALATS